MRKLIWFIHQSIDGFMAGRNGDMSVFAPAMTEELWTDLNRLLDTVDATVFGRKTYQEFEAYWPAASSRPSSLKSEVNFSRWIDETPKYVASKTLSKTQWQNSTLLSGSVDDRIRKLKEQAGKNLLVLGSRNLALQLLDAGLVDELQILAHPLLLGAGERLFPIEMKSCKLTLGDTRTFQTGLVRVRYNVNS